LFSRLLKLRAEASVEFGLIVERKKILVVDDEAFVCEFLEEFLSLKGYHVETVLSGQAALNALNEKKFNLVILDIIMPKMDGTEVLRKIKQKQIDVPVLIVSGIKDISIARELIDLGAISFVPKPIDLNILEENVLINIGEP